MIEIKTFEDSYLLETKKLLKDIFYSEHSNENFNEWEFAEQVLKSEGYVPELCLIALEDEEIVGYNILTTALIGQTRGLALGPLGVKAECQNKGIGSRLVNECIERAKQTGAPWIVLLGGNYYQRFGFEKGKMFDIVVSDNAFDNEHIQILFLNQNARIETSGKLIYCDAFYDEQGNLL